MPLSLRAELLLQSLLSVIMERERRITRISSLRTRIASRSYRKNPYEKYVGTRVASREFS